MIIKSEIIKSKLVEKCMTIKELSDKSGISYSTAIKITQDDKPCGYKTIGRIAQALSCKPNEILQV